jgi:hypothetical protein
VQIRRKRLTRLDHKKPPSGKLNTKLNANFAAGHPVRQRLCAPVTTETEIEVSFDKLRAILECWIGKKTRAPDMMRDVDCVKKELSTYALTFPGTVDSRCREDRAFCSACVIVVTGSPINHFQLGLMDEPRDRCFERSAELNENHAFRSAGAMVVTGRPIHRF